jgi:chemotaxis protein MotB
MNTGHDGSISTGHANSAEDMISRLQTMLTVNGRSFSSPVYKANSQVIDMEASRRVEIKFRLKEDEMIEKIAEILGQ